MTTVTHVASSANTATRLLIWVVGKYRARAHKEYLAGRRAFLLPCEQQLGTHCAAYMERALGQSGLGAALRDHFRSCPHGPTVAGLGLLCALATMATGTSFSCGAGICGSKRRRRRTRRPAFKALYDLNTRQSIAQFERKMCDGMRKEGKEVCVTAFCHGREVLAATASIGSRFKCEPADNPRMWGPKACRIGATEIRQYHNHPAVRGRSAFSRADEAAYLAWRPVVEAYGVHFRSFMVHPGLFGDWVTTELWPHRRPRA